MNQSAFGVEHDSEINKELRPVQGMRTGFRGKKLYQNNSEKIRTQLKPLVRATRKLGSA